MEIEHKITLNQTHTQNFIVEPNHTAAHIGSGSIQVLATPMIIAFMESVSLNLLDQFLPQGFSSVGTHVNIKHLAPSLVGSTIRVKAEVTQIEGKAITLKVEAWEGETLAGSGEHTRYLIEIERFMQKLKKN